MASKTTTTLQADDQVAVAAKAGRWARLLALLQRLRAIVATALVIVVLGLAVLAGLVNLLSPYANKFKPDAEHWLSQRLGQPVTLDRLQAQWQLRGPRLIVEGLRIGTGEDESADLYVGTANFGVDLLHWIDPRRRGVSYFQLVGEDIELIRGLDGAWQLTGLGGDVGPDQRSSGTGLSWLLQQSSISFDARHFTLRDEITQRALQTSNVRLSFNNLQDRFVISGRAGEPEVGELTFSVELDWPEDADGWEQARVYLQGDQLALPTWLGGLKAGGVRVLSGHVDLELRAWIEALGPTRVVGETDLQGLVLSGDQPVALADDDLVAPRYSLDQLLSQFDVAVFEQGWQVQLDDVLLRRGERAWPVTDVVVAQSDGRYAVEADFLRIEDVIDGALVSTALPESIRHSLYELTPQGELTELRVHGWRPDGWLGRRDGVDVSAQLNQLSWRPLGQLPGVSGLDASISTAGQSIEFAMSGDELLLDYPRRLRWPLLLEDFTTTAQLNLQAEQWQLDAPHFAFSDAPMNVVGSMSMSSSESGRPFVDLQLDVSDGLIANAKRYWPRDRFKPTLLNWLDRALVGGRINDGKLILYGDLDDWPFDGNQGRFGAVANIDDVTLDYHSRWPAVTGMAAQMHFDPHGIAATVADGQVSGVAVRNARAALPTYKAPRIELQIEGAGSGAQMLEFLRETPVDTSFAQQLTIEGAGEILLDLELPLRSDLPAREVSGYVQLDQTVLSDAAWGIEFEQASGRIDYTDSGFEVQGMPALFRGAPVNLSLRSGQFTNDPSKSIEADLVGTAPASTFIPDAPLLAPVLQSIVGSPLWRASIALPRRASDQLVSSTPPDLATELVISSDLLGATTSLPVPLAKPAAQLMPIELRLPIGQSSQDLLVKIADLGELRLDRSSPTMRGTLLFGEGLAQLEPGPGLSIQGALSTIDVDGWREWVMPVVLGSVGTGAALDSRFIRQVDLTVDQARLNGRDFSNLQINATPAAQNWQVELVGDQLEGRVRIPLQVDDKQLMLAEFTRLDWPSSVLAESSDKPINPTISPASYPPLQFIAEQMTLDGLDLGRVRLDAYPIVDGMHIETFEAQSPAMRISASGDWMQLGDRQQSAVNATMTAENLGQLLRSFGVSGVVEGGQTLAKVDAYWPGSPADFDLSRLIGDLAIDIGRGQITEVEPGAGRLIGLLSLQYLPRRLAFDFADFFDAGLTFDSLRGQFKLAGGNAQTDGVRIKGPTAEIVIAGRAGLAQRDYDQVVTVTPKVSGALPLIGALAGGPGGAAAGAVLQSVLKQPLGRMAQFQYSVTGSWDEPLIEPSGRREVPAVPTPGSAEQLPSPDPAATDGSAASSSDPPDPALAPTLERDAEPIVTAEPPA